jgi:hypothetical protein
MHTWLPGLDRGRYIWLRVTKPLYLPFECHASAGAVFDFIRLYPLRVLVAWSNELAECHR